MKRTPSFILTFFVVLSLFFVPFNFTYADELSDEPAPLGLQQQQMVPSAPQIQANSYVLMDADTGKVLAENKSDVPFPPASITKIMTLYVVSNALAQKQLQWDTLVPISEKAWRMSGSRMFVQVGDRIPVHQIVQGIVVASGNDASVAMAEHLAGTEDAFAELMNQQAAALGMKNSHFTDSTGMPNPNHYVTAKDMALLARAMIKHFPKDYKIYSQKEFTFNNITQPNRNQLLWLDPTVDGLKTGHTEEAGYCLVASAQRNGMRLISVILGAPSNKVRMEETQRLLNYGFRFYETQVLYHKNTPIMSQKVWFGKQDMISIGAKQDIALTLLRGQFKDMKIDAHIELPIEAPLRKNQKLGTMDVVQNKKILLSVPLVALNDVEEAGFFSRMFSHIKFWFAHLFGTV